MEPEESVANTNKYDMLLEHVKMEKDIRIVKTRDCADAYRRPLPICEGWLEKYALNRGWFSQKGWGRRYFSLTHHGLGYSHSNPRERKSKYNGANNKPLAVDEMQCVVPFQMKKHEEVELLPVYFIRDITVAHHPAITCSCSNGIAFSTNEESSSSYAEKEESSVCGKANKKKNNVSADGNVGSMYCNSSSYSSIRTCNTKCDTRTKNGQVTSSLNVSSNGLSKNADTVYSNNNSESKDVNGYLYNNTNINKDGYRNRNCNGDSNDNKMESTSAIGHANCNCRNTNNFYSNNINESNWNNNNRKSDEIVTTRNSTNPNQNKSKSTKLYYYLGISFEKRHARYLLILRTDLASEYIKWSTCLPLYLHEGSARTLVPTCHPLSQGHGGYTDSTIKHLLKEHYLSQSTLPNMLTYTDPDPASHEECAMARRRCLAWEEGEWQRVICGAESVLKYAHIDTRVTTYSKQVNNNNRNNKSNRKNRKDSHHCKNKSEIRTNDAQQGKLANAKCTSDSNTRKDYNNNNNSTSGFKLNMQDSKCHTFANMKTELVYCEEDNKAEEILYSERTRSASEHRRFMLQEMVACAPSALSESSEDDMVSEIFSPIRSHPHDRTSINNTTTTTTTSTSVNHSSNHYKNNQYNDISNVYVIKGKVSNHDNSSDTYDDLAISNRQTKRTASPT